MFTQKKTVGAAFALLLIGAATLTGCSMGASTDSGAKTETSQSPSKESTPSPSSTKMDPSANLVGPGCAAYAAQVPSGAGSIQGMSQDPVAVAASNNPMLKTLVSAVSGKLNRR